MKKLVILISNAGTGSNLQAIIDAINTHTIQAKIAAVVSDRNDAEGLSRATKNGIKTITCPRKENLLGILQNERPNYIVLVGWKQLIANDVLHAFPQKILNLHPGIIPDTIDGACLAPDGTNALWNKGMFTDTAIQNTLSQKTTYAGSSIHFLSDVFDFGLVLGRTFEKIEPDDTIESLYTRLKKKENQLYVKVLQKLCDIDSSS